MNKYQQNGMNDMNPTSKGDMGAMNPGAQAGNANAVNGQMPKKDDKLSMMKDILKSFIKK